MEKYFKNIAAFFLLGVFGWFSAGITNLVTTTKNSEDICRLQKSCECCSSESKSACCSGNLTEKSIKVTLPCSHPGFNGKDFHFDPAAVYTSGITTIKVTTPDYLILNIYNPGNPEIIRPFRPPANYFLELYN